MATTGQIWWPSAGRTQSRHWALPNVPRAYYASPDKHGGHRALADIKESVKELRYYREAVFVPRPGPDSVTAREIAARFTEPSVVDGTGS